MRCDVMNESPRSSDQVQLAIQGYDIMTVLQLWLGLVGSGRGRSRSRGFADGGRDRTLVE